MSTSIETTITTKEHTLLNSANSGKAPSDIDWDTNTVLVIPVGTEVEYTKQAFPGLGITKHTIAYVEDGVRFIETYIPAITEE